MAAARPQPAQRGRNLAVSLLRATLPGWREGGREGRGEERGSKERGEILPGRTQHDDDDDAVDDDDDDTRPDRVSLLHDAAHSRAPGSSGLAAFALASSSSSPPRLSTDFHSSTAATVALRLPCLLETLFKL